MKSTQPYKAKFFNSEVLLKLNTRYMYINALGLATGRSSCKTFELVVVIILVIEKKKIFNRQ